MSSNRYFRKAVNSAIGTGVGMAMRGVKNAIINRPSKYASRTSMSKAFHRIKKLERGQSGKELKTHDLDISETPSSTATVTLLNGIAQGDTSKTREGLHINIQSIRIKLRNSTQSHASIWPYYMRFILVKDRQNSGTVPSIAEMLEGTDVTDFKEHDEKHRFQFLWDKTITINPNTINIAGDAYFLKGNLVQYYKRFKKPVKAWYTGTSAAQASVDKNSFYLVMLGSHATTWTSTGHARIRFTD